MEYVYLVLLLLTFIFLRLFINADNTSWLRHLVQYTSWLNEHFYFLENHVHVLFCIAIYKLEITINTSLLLVQKSCH